MRTMIVTKADSINYYNYNEKHLKVHNPRH